MKMGRRGNSQIDGGEVNQNNMELQRFTISSRMLENDTVALQPEEVHLGRNYPQNISRINEGSNGSCNEQLPIRSPRHNRFGFRSFLGRIKDIRKSNDNLSCNR
jgi:hypothetical protein